jgi:hypothetical protein
MSETPSLTALQNSFQDAVLGGSDAILAAILPSQQLDSAARLAVYQHAYGARLAECLGNDYPVLRLLLGEESFAALAEAYITATPSTDPNVRWYGRHLPEFLSQREPWCATRRLADLAEFERALGNAFDAADVPPCDADALAAFAAEDQPRLCFAFVPSLAVLTLSAGTLATYEAVIEDAAADLPESEDAETILVWRDDAGETLYRALDADETLALTAAVSGAILDEICGHLSLRHEAETAAGLAGGFLGRWFTDGLVVSLSCR